MKEEVIKKLLKLREDVSFQYYEISNPMEAPKILKKLDSIIKLAKSK